MDPLPALPTAVREELDRVVAAARNAFGEDLVSAVLYGSAAEGRLRTTSDVNVMLVLKRFEKARAELLRDPVRNSQAAVRLEVVFLLESEIADAIEAFAEKYSDVHARHHVLFGSDPFAKIVASRDAMIRRVRQIMLNLRIRLRNRYVMAGERGEQFTRLAAEMAAPLRAAAAAILALEGAPAESPKVALERIAAGLKDPKWPAVLGRISEAREGGTLDPRAGEELAFDLMELASALYDRAGKLG